MMRTDAFLKIFEDVDVGTILVIKHYRGQDGSIKDLTVRVLNPDTGYRTLTLESRDQVQKMLATEQDPSRREALTKLLTGFTKSLTGEARKGHYVEKLTQVGGTPLQTSDKTPEGIFILRHLEIVAPPVIHQDPDPPKSASRGRATLNVLADEIKAKLPIGRYLGRLNLRPMDLWGVEISCPAPAK